MSRPLSSRTAYSVYDGDPVVPIPRLFFCVIVFLVEGREGKRRKLKPNLHTESTRMRKRTRRGDGTREGEGVHEQDEGEVQRTGTTTGTTVVESGETEKRSEEDNEDGEVERIEVPPDHWLIKRRWKIVKKNSGKKAQRERSEDDEDEEDEDVVYEYEVDQRRALIFMLTRLVAVGLLFLLFHNLFFSYVWDPSASRLTPEQEAINKFKALGQL